MKLWNYRLFSVHFNWQNKTIILICAISFFCDYMPWNGLAQIYCPLRSATLQAPGWRNLCNFHTSFCHCCGQECLGSTPFLWILQFAAMWGRQGRRKREEPGKRGPQNTGEWGPNVEEDVVAGAQRLNSELFDLTVSNTSPSALFS